MWLTRLLLSRCAAAVVTLWFVSLVVFLATQALPGDAAVAILGHGATEERLAVLREQLNLNDPLVVQYGHWVGGVVRGDLGTSVASRLPVTQELAPRLVNSAVLMAFSAAVAVPLSLALGVWLALRRDSVADHAVSLATLVLASMPEFVVGIGLLLLLAVGAFQVLPAVSLAGHGTAAWQDLPGMILPVLTLSLVLLPYLSRLMRASMVEVLSTEYVQMARLKGLPPRAVLSRHALPNAAVPAIQLTALQLGWLAGGIVVVEYLFRFQGLGSALVSAVENRDVPVVQAITLCVGLAYIVFNLAADVATTLIVPRLRSAARQRGEPSRASKPESDGTVAP